MTALSGCPSVALRGGASGGRLRLQAGHPGFRPQRADRPGDVFGHRTVGGGRTGTGGAGVSGGAALIAPA